MSDNSYPGSAKDDKYNDYQSSFKDVDDSDNDDDGREERGGKGKKKYSVIPQAVREKFIKRVMSKEVTIKEAAKEFGLKFSTSKAILQTYKKEGRIGKKKNRERKTKILNVVFLCNVNQMNPYASSVFPIVSVNEMKGPKGLANAEANKNKLVEQTLINYPEHKIVHQTHMQIPHETNKSTQQYIKDLGNDFLKDFIEKNFSGNKMPQLGSLPNDMHSYNPTTSGINPSSQPSSSNISNPNNLPHLSNSSNMPSHTFNGLSSLNGNGLMGQAFSVNDVPRIAGLGQFNQFNSHHGMHGGINQKRPYGYENEFELKNEQISDISVKKFKSGEDVLWDYDLDRSKRDLEDFIYKTHNAIKNNTYVEKAVTFDFSKYKDEFNE